MRSLVVVLFSLLFALPAGGQSSRISREVNLDLENAALAGTLLLPDSLFRGPVVLIIAGSGPTDRNGNNPGMENNSLKMVADSLCAAGIASLRYDKRGVGGSTWTEGKEENLRFEHLADDAAAWIVWLREQGVYSKIVVAGHSEGSLMGMLAVKKAGADGFISLAGAGQTADVLIRNQLGAQPPRVLEQSADILSELKAGRMVDSVPAYLNALFRPSVQPYLVSWFRYDPVQEIAALDCPVLIVQGTTDIQVDLNEARLLAAARPKDQLVIIEGMNHIFKPAEAHRMINIATYRQPDLPLAPGFAAALSAFIHAQH